MDKHLSIQGMSCGHCTSRVQRALEKIDGVTVSSIDLQGCHVSVPDSVSDAQLKAQVEDAGYSVISIS